MATNKIVKIGYGQVEPNRLTAQRTKEVFAQLPAASSIPVIENGMAMVYDQVKGEVRFAKDASEKVCLVMTEINLPDPDHQADSDFAIFHRPETAYQVEMKAYPRLFALHKGDTFTTNTVKIDTKHADASSSPVPAGTLFAVDTDGYWVQVGTPATGYATNTNVQVACVKDYTLADGQRALKMVVTAVNDGAVSAA